jgi:protein-disulfide isomerase
MRAPCVTAIVLVLAACTPTPDEPQNTLELPGLDQRDFTVREKNEFATLATELIAPCPNVAVPVAQCVKENRACDQCMPAAKFIYDGVRHGEPREEIENAYKDRFDPAHVKVIPIDGSPVKGPDGARVTLVEFADFECPACGRLAPLLERILENHPGDVRLVYKFYPLTQIHHHAEDAARAGIAAMMQGKFWEMNHTMFANQEELRHEDLYRYAKELGLDVERLKKDMLSADATARIAKDVALVGTLGVDHTPTVFLDGRPVDLAKYDIEQLVEEELKPAGQ